MNKIDDSKGYNLPASRLYVVQSYDLGVKRALSYLAENHDENLLFYLISLVEPLCRQHVGESIVQDIQ